MLHHFDLAIKWFYKVWKVFFSEKQKKKVNNQSVWAIITTKNRQQSLFFFFFFFIFSSDNLDKKLFEETLNSGQTFVFFSSGIKKFPFFIFFFRGRDKKRGVFFQQQQQNWCYWRWMTVIQQRITERSLEKKKKSKWINMNKKIKIIFWLVF